MGRYALLKRYEIMRDEFVFPEKLPLAYAYPRKKPLPFVYRGLGREERDLYDPLADPLPEEAAALIGRLEEGTLSLPALWENREKTLLYASCFDGAEDYECLFAAPPEEDAPEDLVLLGFDAGYAPEEELFSAVSDLFFFPLWQKSKQKQLTAVSNQLHYFSVYYSKPAVPGTHLKVYSFRNLSPLPSLNFIMFICKLMTSISYRSHLHQGIALRVGLRRDPGI